MASPFPGMDPYLEGALWPDVHQALATKIRQLLVPLVLPRYAVRLEISVIEDTEPDAEIGISYPQLYPDIEVVKTGAHNQSGLADNDLQGMTPVSLTIPLPAPVPVRLISVEIHELGQPGMIAQDRSSLVTVIEVLSPVNKHGDGLRKYREKRQRLHQAGVHILELDLLRRGTRPVEHPRIPPVPYLVSLTRAGVQQVSLWLLSLAGQLPTVPVPLVAPDHDAPLELGRALREIYAEAAYQLSIDYQQPPPPPPLSEQDALWLDQQLRAAGLR